METTSQIKLDQNDLLQIADIIALDYTKKAYCPDLTISETVEFNYFGLKMIAQYDVKRIFTKCRGGSDAYGNTEEYVEVNGIDYADILSLEAFNEDGDEITLDYSQNQLRTILNTIVK